MDGVAGTGTDGAGVEADAPNEEEEEDEDEDADGGTLSELAVGDTSLPSSLLALASAAAARKLGEKRMSIDAERWCTPNARGSSFTSE